MCDMILDAPTEFEWIMELLGHAEDTVNRM